jgi:hypothetical protein
VFNIHARPQHLVNWSEFADYQPLAADLEREIAEVLGNAK